MLRFAMISMLAVLACGKASEPSKSAPPPAGGSAPASAGASTISGTWTGTWTRTLPAGGGGELTLTMGATPTFRRAGTACPPEETPATVTVSGDRVTIDVSTDEVKATYTGTRSGNDISGELVTTCKLGTGKGTFKLSAK